jgi:two-component system NtrC family sensor kinase
MSTDGINSKHTPRTRAVPSSEWDDAERFRALCYELLKHSSQGLLRKEFLPEVSQRIMVHSGCDAAELWVKEGPHKHFRCSVSGTRKSPFGFVLVPCALGEVASPPEDEGELDLEELCCDLIKGSADGSHPCITESGSFWADGACEAIASGDLPSQVSSQRVERLPKPYNSIVIIPIRPDRECIGLLQLKSRQRGFFSIRDVNFYEEISKVLGIALSHQYAQAELRERIKEITCLYGIARVTARLDASFDEVIQGITDLLPSAWLYPEIASARIVLDGRTYVTANFHETPYRQVADVVSRGKKIGFVEVAYAEAKVAMDEGPFLAEERRLIDSVAREVAGFCERARAEEEKAFLQSQLRHADRLATIGQLVAGVAHELNEPLGNVLGFAQLASKSPDLPAQAAKDVREIESAALRGREIVRKLMAFARQLPPQKMPVSLNGIVTDGLYLYEDRCAKAGIQMVYRLSSDLPKIDADPGQMNQVLVNLVVNAIQAMPAGGVLAVETRLAEGGVCLSVGDTGVGISEEMKSKIFLPFFTTKDVHEGTGLGLAVVHGIVASHGGKIVVESQVGKGARFDIHLPLTTPGGGEERQA